MVLHKARVLAIGGLLALGGPLAACDDGGTNGGNDTGTAPAVTTTVASDPPGEQPQYFGTQEHVGEQVTITVPVATNLTDGSLVLDARAYGDENLLVLFPEDQQFAEGQNVTATGTVRQFSYDQYADQYGLGEATLFEIYANETFLAADTVIPQA